MPAWADTEKLNFQPYSGDRKAGDRSTVAAARSSVRQALDSTYQARAAAVAYIATPALLLPAIFDGRGIRGLFAFNQPYPKCDPATLDLPSFLPEFVRQALGCPNLTFMLAIATIVYWSAVASFFIRAFEGRAAPTGGDDTDPEETRKKTVSSPVGRDLVMLTASCLLIAYAGSVRDPAVLFLIICPLIVDMHMLLCTATDYIEYSFQQPSSSRDSGK